MALTAADDFKESTARYASLGLIGNPFAPVKDEPEDLGAYCEIAAAKNELLVAMLEQSREESPKPLWVEKSPDIPSFYPLAAGAGTEFVLANDDALNIAYGYVQLSMMRIGVVRATLRILAERLAFRSFDRTLAAYLERILAEPDTELASYRVLGPERLETFTDRFREDPLALVHECFGTPESEREPEIAQVADLRHLDLEGDVEEENDASAEVDATVGEAPGTTHLLMKAEKERTADEDDAAFRDYVFEHTAVHLSTVVARALRAYHLRGLTAMSTEFTVTKAPRKTLAAIVKLATTRYRKVALLYDAFDNWMDIDPELRTKIAGSFTEMRWRLAGDAFIVMFVEPGSAPELEETFRVGRVVSWDFADLASLQEDRDLIRHDVVNKWFAAASLPQAEPLTMDDPIISRLAEAAAGSLKTFAETAYAAIEDAADRGIGSLDEAAYEAGVSHVVQESQ